MRSFTSLYGILVCLILVVSFSSTVIAAEPVQIIVSGVEGDVRQNVREALSLPAGLVREGKVDRLWLERFAHQAEEITRTAVEPYGYYQAKVTTSLQPIDEGHYLLRVNVVSGPPVRLDEIKVQIVGPGAREDSLKKLVEGFPLHKGEVLLQQKYDRAKGALKTQAQEQGYLDADFTSHEIRIDRTLSTARIELIMQTGEQYRFDGVRLEGASGYPDTFLRRYLAFKTGEVFSFAKIGETQLNFTNSERFKEVIVAPQKQEAVGLQVPVLVQLKPAPSRHLRPGIGYGTDTGARFSIRYQDLNLFDRGHEFNSILYISERLQGLVANYTVPSPKDYKSSTSVQLNLQQESVTAYLSRLIAVELDRNHTFGKGELGTAYVRVQLEDFTIGSQNSTSRLVLPGYRFSKNRYDNIIRPTQGYRFALDLRGTHQILGSDTALIQFIAEGSHMLPLPWRLSLHTRGKVGITPVSDTLTEFPPSLRFFAGGDQSVRGYSYQSLGPVDASGQVVGGRHLLVGSVELERALFKDWGVSLFYDAGNAFESFTGVKLFQGAGIGVHYYTRIGAVNLAVARQIGVDHPGFHIHFTLGFEL